MNIARINTERAVLFLRAQFLEVLVNREGKFSIPEIVKDATESDRELARRLRDFCEDLRSNRLPNRSKYLKDLSPDKAEELERLMDTSAALEGIALFEKQNQRNVKR